jgi:hypothetical protein
VLGSFARKKVARVIADLERRFPQVAVAVVLTEVPQQAPLAAYAFWIFEPVRKFVWRVKPEDRKT